MTSASNRPWSRRKDPSTRSRPRRRRQLTDPPPVYQIDLSLPPEERHVTICQDYKREIAELVSLYHDILHWITSYPRPFDFLAKRLLKRVHSREEAREINGISRASGVPLHLVVAYNTFLDLFSGCTSGGARVSDAGLDRTRTGIVHFRGLDWEMEPLRRMVISVEYMREGKVIARGVTYAGYVGVLTGVRLGLSISLNYRASLGSPHNVLRHRWHQLLMLLGFRPSIASHLRTLLLSHAPPPPLKEISSRLSKTSTTPCYLTFCTPKEILVIEKDLASQVVQTSSQFLAVTNHDRRVEAWGPEKWRKLVEEDEENDTSDDGIPGVSTILKDSIERRVCVEQFWKADATGRPDPDDPSSPSRSTTSDSDSANLRVEVDDVKYWMQTYPIRNEATHFSCIMDPSVDGGGLLWVKAYLTPPPGKA